MTAVRPGSKIAAAAPAAWRAAWWTDPHCGLAVAVVVALVGEWLLWAGPFAAGQDSGEVGFVVTAAAVLASVVALTIWQDAAARRTGGAGLGRLALAGAAAAVILGLLVVRFLVGGAGGLDLELYQSQGAILLDTGRLPTDPAAEYPPLAVIAFATVVALDRLLPVGFGVAFGLSMAVLQTGMWWLLARRVPAWAVVATSLWPTVAVFALIRFDALPTVMLVGGLLLAARHDPDDLTVAGAGALLGLGAAAKWFPGLAAVVLAVGWWRAGRRRAAAILSGATAAAFLVPHLPFLTSAAQRTALLDAYRFHEGRGLTGESLPFLPLHLLGLATRPERPWFEAAVDPAAGWVPAAVLAVAVLCTLVLAVWRPRAALAWAVLAPVAFLLGNRIFSPQFLLPLVALWAVGTLGSTAPLRARLAFLGLTAVAVTANWGIWPVLADRWVLLSWTLFAAAVALTVMTGRWLAHVAASAPATVQPSRPGGAQL